ncbi:MAG: hypothetical protein KAX39_01155 [candidate division Zixibacteria bacterium]|nr:hypothetical protein [candidate division Zixibacteria bacterium]
MKKRHSGIWNLIMFLLGTCLLLCVAVLFNNKFFGTGSPRITVKQVKKVEHQTMKEHFELLAKQHEYPQTQKDLELAKQKEEKQKVISQKVAKQKAVPQKREWIRARLRPRVKVYYGNGAKKRYAGTVLDYGEQDGVRYVLLEMPSGRCEWKLRNKMLEWGWVLSDDPALQ